MSPARGNQKECSVLFAYTLDAVGHPEIWEVQFRSDRYCGARLETFRLNSNGEFHPAAPDMFEGIYRLQRIYKVQIQDDSKDFCAPPHIYKDECLFLLETVPAAKFD